MLKLRNGAVDNLSRVEILPCSATLKYGPVALLSNRFLKQGGKNNNWVRFVNNDFKHGCYFHLIAR